jgi:TRAP-type transport system periplasmic protein
MNMTSDPKGVTRRDFLLRAAALAVGLGGVGPFPGRSSSAYAATSKAHTRLRLGTFTQEEFINTKVARKFASIVSEKSGGEINVEVFPAAQLGGEKDLAEGVRLGTIDICMNSGVVGQWVPKWGITDLPFLYKDYEHSVKAVQGPILETLHPLLNAAGFHVLGVGSNVPRLTYARRPVKSLADFKGLKIRVPEVPIFVETFKALGATPTPIPAPEIYSALSTGIVDAQEGAPDWVYSLRSYEVVKYLIMTAHIMNGEIMLMSEARWKKVPGEVQKVLKESGDGAYKWFVAERKKEGQEGIDKLIAAGMTQVKDINREEMAKAVEPLHERFGKEQGVADLIRKVKALA